MTAATLHCDGGCEPNPGAMGIGGHITIDGIDVADFSEAAGNGTNNQAEYLALIKGAKLALQLNVTHLNVNMDSLLIVNQMTGKWRNKETELTRLMHEAQKVMADFEDVSYEQIPREKNKQADMLATQGRTGTSDTKAKKKISAPSKEDPQDILQRIEKKLDILLAKMGLESE
ncbi:MAG: ribonuclease HI [Candidatus Latescibacterota bacterium]|jgi:ribonuclease HI